MARISRVKAQERKYPPRTMAEEMTVSHNEAKKGTNIAGLSSQNGDSRVVGDREPATKRQRTDAGL